MYRCTYDRKIVTGKGLNVDVTYVCKHIDCGVVSLMDRALMTISVWTAIKFLGGRGREREGQGEREGERGRRREIMKLV